MCGTPFASCCTLSQRGLLRSKGAIERNREQGTGEGERKDTASTPARRREAEVSEDPFRRRRSVCAAYVASRTLQGALWD